MAFNTNFATEIFHTVFTRGSLLKESLRQDPLDLSFWSFLTFLHHGIEEGERHHLWKFHKKFKGKVGQMCHQSCSLALGFYTKLFTKSAVSESSIALGRLNLTFLSLGLSLWNLAHLFIMFMATKRCLRFFNFCLGTQLWLFQSRKNGVKSSVNFERS